ncbi:MAG: signal peptidase I [Bacilli bacterium]|nr:signal peptidase I [Bacilli bacterium]
MNKLKNLVPYIIIFILVVIIRTYLISPAKVKGESMEPVLYNNEIVFINKYTQYLKNYKRFDMVVVKIENEYLIKRIIGFENEKIEYKDDILYIDGKQVKVPLDFEYTKDFEASVEKDSVFVLGDNRNVSKDSRFYGSFRINDLRGTVKVRLYPFNKIGLIK